MEKSLVSGKGFTMTGLNIPNFASRKERPVLPEPTFQKNSKPRQNTFVPEEREPLTKEITGPPSILSIGNGVVLSGKIEEAEKVIIHGTVDAEINAKSVDVVAEGSLTGTTIAMDLSISGQFKGSAEITGKLKIERGGSLEGDVSYGELTVESGGVLIGDISRSVSEKPQKATPPTGSENPDQRGRP